MPATPVYALPYPASTDPADVPADLQRLAEQVAKILGGALSATPPASPVDGQLWNLPAAAGTVWTFRYNAGSASAFKWEFVGGPSLQARVDGILLTTNTTFTDLGGPAITVPRAGDYEINFGADLSNGEAGEYARCAPKLGATAPSDANRIEVYGVALGSATTSAARTIIGTGLAASDVVKLWYYGNAGGGTNMNATLSWLAVRPVRVS